VDVPALPAGCAFPQAVLSPLLDAWRTARGQALIQPAELLAAAAAAGLLPRPGTGMRFSRCARGVACRRATVAASALASARQLRAMARATGAAAAACLTLPARLGRAQNALMWTHLIKVPLTVRAAAPSDTSALLRLQDASLSTLRVRLTCVRHTQWFVLHAHLQFQPLSLPCMH